MKRLTEIESAWLAGFLEGEGSFIISQNSDNGHYRPRVSSAQVDPKPLLRLQELVGGGGIHHHISNGYKKSLIYCHVVIDCRSVRRLIKSIYPYLVSSRTRKRAWCVYKLAVLVSSANRDRKGRYPRLSQKNIKERKKVYEVWKTTRRGKWATK